MAQIASLPGRVNTGEDLLTRGVRRSRFSLHLNTPRTRRWLLVQWVSAPAQATAEWFDSLSRRLSQKSSRPNLARLLDDHTMQTSLRRTI